MADDDSDTPDITIAIQSNINFNALTPEQNAKFSTQINRIDFYRGWKPTYHAALNGNACALGWLISKQADTVGVTKKVDEELIDRRALETRPAHLSKMEHVASVLRRHEDPLLWSWIKAAALIDSGRVEIVKD